MKRIICIVIILAATLLSQPPVVTQIGQYSVGPTQAHDIQFWGDDFIASRYTYESGSAMPYHEELILLNITGGVIWRKDFPPAGGAQKTQLVTNNLFCIFSIGNKIYKIDKTSSILQIISVPTENGSLGIQKQESGIIFIEGTVSASQSTFFVYDDNLNFLKSISGQPGATYSVCSFENAYFISGTKYGNGLLSNVSSHIAKYDTSGNVLWLKQFPDVTSMHIIINDEKLYFCGANKGTAYQTMEYGEISKESGNIIWARNWGAPYPSNFVTMLSFSQIEASPDGGFVAIGASTAPGQIWSNYEPNLPVGLIFGYSPQLTQPWIKYTDDFGGLLSGDWKDSNLAVFGNLGSYPNVVAKALIYSVSGLTAIENDETNLQNFSLAQNYPNPFNPSTKIRFSLDQTGFASLKVYDLLGREVAALVNEELPAGEYETSLDASSLASGLYIYTLSVGQHAVSRKMVLLR